MGAAISYKYTNNYSTLHGYKVMTVRIDETDPNPDTCCTYQDDAVGMSSGATAEEWTEFFGYKPCLLRNSRNGLEVKYLNPDDYTKFIDGTTADITSGNAGDVMIEFPRRGIKLSRSGNYLYVSMTDDPDADGYNYNAHTKGTTIYDNLYIAAYYPYVDDFSGSPVLTSLADSNPRQTLDNHGTYRAYLSNKGSSYSLMTFYQLTYLQTLMLLQFRTTKSKSALGAGESNAGSGRNWRGWAKSKGLFFQIRQEDTSSGNKYGWFKAFGIEDLYEQRDGTLIEGIVAKYDESSSTYTFYTALDDFEFTSNYSLPQSYREVCSCVIPPHRFGDPDFKLNYITQASPNSNSGFLPLSLVDANSTPSAATQYYCAEFCAPDRDRRGYEVVTFNANDTPGMFSITVGGKPLAGTNDAIFARTNAWFVCYK